MKKRQIARELKKRYKVLERTGRMVDDSCAVEHIHQFRLSYKRINSLLEMLACRKWAKELSISSKLKKVYKCSGTIRKLQLQLATFKRTRNKYAAQYRRTLRTAMEVAKQQLIKHLSPKLIDKCRNQNINEVKGSFRAKDYLKFLVAKSEWIGRAVQEGAISDRKLHAIRKELKGILYTKSLFKDASYQDRQLYRIYNFSSGKLLQRLGCFHDQCNTIDLLAPERYPELGHQAVRWMRGQRQRVAKGKAKMKRRLSAQLKQIFNRQQKPDYGAAYTC